MFSFKNAGLFLLLPVFIIGLITGLYLEKFLSKSDKNIYPREKHLGQLDLINPLLECSDEDISTEELAPFKDRILEVIEDIKDKRMVTDMSVYFRDLNDGPWFGINEKEKFFPASLMKLPIMINYLKTAEEDPKVLDKKLRFDPGKLRSFPPSYIKPRESLKPGNSYQVKELIYRMITFSDNDSMDVLLFYPGVLHSRFFRQLNIDMPKDENYIINLKEYASIFRILFNATYLSRGFSDEALVLLSETDFKKGLVAGVPEGITVAHKFGEKGLSEGGQFHDCGIIYYPKNPYMLCIMSRGENPEDLIAAIAEVSRTVYKEVDRQMTTIDTR